MEIRSTIYNGPLVAGTELSGGCGLVTAYAPDRNCDAIEVKIGIARIGYIHYEPPEGASWDSTPILAHCSDFTFEPVAYGGPGMNAQFRRKARIPKSRPSLQSILKTLDRKARNGVFAHITKGEETPEPPF